MKLHSTHPLSDASAMVVPHRLIPLKLHYGALVKVHASDSHLSKEANGVTTKINDVNVAIADARIGSYNCYDGLFHENAMMRQHGGVGGFLCCPHERCCWGIILPIGCYYCADGPFFDYKRD